MKPLHDAALSDSAFKRIQSLIYDLAGIALADSKHVMVESRLGKRLRALGLPSYRAYLELLERPDQRDELTRFVNALTTNKTDFFREPHHFEFLRDTAFPEIVRRAGSHRRLRIWCAAASTGEEPYTIAMTVREFFGGDDRWDIRILASDIDTDVLTTASAGVYSRDRFEGVEPALIRKYFAPEPDSNDRSLRVKPVLRELITYRQLNLNTAGWPIRTQFDIIFCRNVMIYFDTDSQKKIVAQFAKFLKPESWLLIGHSESLFGISDCFESIGATVYRRVGGSDSAQHPRSSGGSDQSSGPGPAAPGVSFPSQRPPASGPSAIQAQGDSNASPVRVSRPSEPAISNVPHARIILGSVYVSSEPIWISTVLGTCVAVCLYDEQARIGGMNHFMLPEGADSAGKCASYGVHAMEQLINAMMNKGAARRRLKAKVFGGNSVIGAGRGTSVGQSNVEFAHNFLQLESIPIEASYTQTDSGVHVAFHATTYKVRVKRLDSRTAKAIQSENTRRAKELETQLDQGDDITLF